MYLEHFGFQRQPFSITPDTHFFLELGSTRDLYRKIIQGINRQRQPVAVIGESGMGKTVLCRRLIKAIRSHRGRYHLCYLPDPTLPEKRLRKTLDDLWEFSRSSSLLPVIVIDEAQAMPTESLILLGQKLEDNANAGQLVPCVLFAQTELYHDLQQPGLAPLARQLDTIYRLEPLTAQETGVYLQQRLQRAAYQGPPLFTESLTPLIHDLTGGTPRLINILAHKILMVAYGKGISDISRNHVMKAATDTESLQ